jgi:pyrroloquinoline quinone (PQQ) biosynthesis protein C
MAELQKSIKPERFQDELFAILREHSFRDPMFDAVKSGAMSRLGIRLWTLQASLVVRVFTSFVSAIHSNCPHRGAQQLLAENLWEEHGEGRPDRDHYALIRKLARSLGATDSELDSVEALPETAEYIEHCYDVTRNKTFVEAMTALGLGVERSMPAFFGALAASLCSQYELSPDDVEYLSVHVSQDEAHSRRALELIETYAGSDDVREKAGSALRDMLLVKRRFAEAVYRHCSKVS